MRKILSCILLELRGSKERKTLCCLKFKTRMKHLFTVIMNIEYKKRMNHGNGTFGYVYFHTPTNLIFLIKLNTKFKFNKNKINFQILENLQALDDKHCVVRVSI
ncbi:hypothetical protein ACFFRR_000999 [Megaselia abdita]